MTTGFVISGYFLPIVGTLLIAYLLGTIVYRLCLHPLAGVPGPILAALTYWYEFYYDAIQPAQYVFKIQKLHKEFEPVVRTTPAEVSIADLDFIDTIYSPGPSQKRDKDIEKVKALVLDSSIGGAVGHDLHRRRRRALSSFYSPRQVLRVAPDGEVLNLSDLYFGFANDFGFDQNLMAGLPGAHTRRENFNGVLRAVKLNSQFTWVRDLLRYLARSLPLTLSSYITPQTDTVGRVGQENINSIVHELHNDHKLPQSERSPRRLEDEAVLLLVAGTQSTQVALSLVHYHLMANSTIMANLRAELESQPSSTLAQLLQLPYLNDVVQETHRLAFGVTGRNARVSPDQPTTYVDKSTARTFTFPPGTSMSTSTLLVHANEEIFPDPFAFDPGRWLGPAGAARKNYQMGFSKGPRMCIGMHLVNAEMVIAIAAMARWNLELFATSYEDVTFLHDYHIITPRLDSKGVRACVKSRAQ
ncbi:hypothetical protein JX265_001068 [Neoarthrinium moseri]|uniref:Cytochrome P450 n=1 Tax=Neoarthrinium moseri TaxID=1658444 RepID=A0A9P9WWZ9_9PEZI|nr:hypothetical protein JX265_001068 [Neoarthrinium moseri]